MVYNQIRCHRMQHLINVYTVCHSCSNLWTLSLQQAVKWTCSKFRKSMVRRWGLSLFKGAGLSGPVERTSDWWSGDCGFDPCWVGLFFGGDWSWNIFYGHSIPSAASRSARQFLAKECAQVLVNSLEDETCPGKVWLSELTGSIWP